VSHDSKCSLCPNIMYLIQNVTGDELTPATGEITPTVCGGVSSTFPVLSVSSEDFLRSPPMQTSSFDILNGTIWSKERTFGPLIISSTRRGIMPNLRRFASPRARRPSRAKSHLRNGV
jgi:hypothetical protein